MAITAYTYDDNARREDLLDIITNLSPTDTQLMTGLGQSVSKDILHQWLTDTLATVATNAFPEGIDATFATVTNPTRLTNYCQIIKKGAWVTGTEEAVNSAGFSSRMAYEIEKRLKEWKNDAEYAVLRGSLSCGNNSTARAMKGIKNWLLSNNYTNASGVSLTEALLNDRFQDVWSDGSEVNALYVPMYIKRKIAAYTGAATAKNVSVEDKRLVNSVDVYQADAAKMVKIFPHRHVTVTGDTNYDIVGIDESKFKIAYLRKPAIVDIAKTGDATKKEIIGELTLECLHGDAGFWAEKML